MMTENKTANNGQPVDIHIQHEISRLTAQVAHLSGPPSTSKANPAPSDPAPTTPVDIPALGQPGWSVYAARQLNNVAEALVTYVKGNGSDKNSPLLPVARTALDLSLSILREGADERIHAERVAKQAKKPDNAAMNDITREELSARLELVESKADARMSRFEERIDSSIGEMRRNTDRLEAAIGNLKTTTVVTAIASVLTIVFGVAAFNSTVLSNMVASFESGKNTAAAISESTKRLEVLQDRIEAQQKPTGPPQPK